MTSPRFVQIHTLASYPAVLLNRDDAGMAKRLPYGGSVRTRVSSQCLKRHWRCADDHWALSKIGAPMSIRSRELIERDVLHGLTGKPEVVEAIRIAMAKKLYGEKSVEVRSRQVMLLGRPELDYLKRLAQEAATEATTAKEAEAAIDARIGKGDGKRNLASMKEVAGNLAAGLESALFGRMVTSDPEANTEAAIHVAHAFTVHAEESESDYFTVVDDLRGAETGEAGTAGIFETELTSGLFYSYVVIDVPGLVDNLGGDRGMAANVVEHLLHLIATISPGAKRGSTAPYSYAELMLVELGERQPRTLANAFRRAVPSGGDVFANALHAMSSYLAGMDASYGSKETRSGLCSVAESNLLPGMDKAQPLDALAEWAAAAVRTG